MAGALDAILYCDVLMSVLLCSWLCLNRRGVLSLPWTERDRFFFSFWLMPKERMGE
jgi:hypothetical protein